MLLSIMYSSVGFFVNRIDVIIGRIIFILIQNKCMKIRYKHILVV
jgi:hypothetical protein